MATIRLDTAERDLQASKVAVTVFKTIEVHIVLDLEDGDPKPWTEGQIREVAGDVYTEALRRMNANDGEHEIAVKTIAENNWSWEVA